MRPPVELGFHRAPRCEPVVSLVRSRRAPPVPLIVLPKSCSCRWGPCPPPLSLVWVVCFLSFFLSCSCMWGPCPLLPPLVLGMSFGVSFYLLFYLLLLGTGLARTGTNTQVHHGSRLSDSCEDGQAHLASLQHSTALAAGKLIHSLTNDLLSADGRVKND